MMAHMTTEPLYSDPITKAQARQIANLLVRSDSPSGPNRFHSVEIRESVTHGTFTVVYYNGCWMERRIETWGEFTDLRREIAERRR